MSVSESDLQEITRSVFAVTLGWSVEVHCPDPKYSHGTGVLSAVVDISGGWDGTVRLMLTEGLGRHIAGAMLGVAPDEIARSAVWDAVGELANMIGGNLKAILPGPCVLSMPMVAPSMAPADRVGSEDVVGAVAVDWEGQTATVTVLRHVGVGGGNTQRTAKGE